MRKEMEKKYVDKWEKARIENFKFKFKSEELELQKHIADLQEKMKTDEIVDEENEKFLDYTIKVSQHTRIIISIKQWHIFICIIHVCTRLNLKKGPNIGIIIYIKIYYFYFIIFNMYIH